jgi:amidase
MGGAALVGGTSTGCRVTVPPTRSSTALAPFALEELSVGQLRRGLQRGEFTAQSLTRAYLDRIAAVDRQGPGLNAIIEMNPEALAQAKSLDAERQAKGPRGPWHGIPVWLKDNIDTGDGMTTTAGSLALEGSRASQDAIIAARLRAAGAVFLGKTNLSEWANFRGSRSISGWSGRGGQTRNPYCLTHNPSGSSSGSAVAVSASLGAVAVGTETNGSIVSPASYCGIVGIKPTVGLVSRRGIIPISASQDTAGPMARTVADAAALLSVLAGPDGDDGGSSRNGAFKGESDYEQFLRADALAQARLGVPRSLFRLHRQVDPVFARVLDLLRQAGAELVEDLELPSRQDLGGADYQVMLFEFKAGLDAYFRTLPRSSIRSVADVIAFNEAHRERELKYFGQETMIAAQAKGPLSSAEYVTARERCRNWSQRLGALFTEQRLDAIVAPTTGPAHVTDFVHGDRGLGGCSTYAAVAGFPHITVPCGDVLGLPVGFSFFGPAWSEPRLIALAHAFEQLRGPRQRPMFAGSWEELLGA